jgi:hypothetical protein
MNETPPEREINFDFLQEEVEWTALVEACRERWAQTVAPLREMEAEFLELQRQLMQEDQPPEELWDHLIEDFDQSPGRSKGLRPYVESAQVATVLFKGPAGSLGWRDASVLRQKLDQSWAALVSESIGSTGLRDALLGIAVQVASRPDFYRPAKVARDKQRGRLRMDTRVPHYYTVSEAPPGTEQPKGAEPRLVWKLRLLAEWHLRRKNNAWPCLTERQRFWTDAKPERDEFLRELFKGLAEDVPEFVPALVAPVIERDTRSVWVKLQAWLGRLWNTLLRHRPDPNPETPLSQVPLISPQPKPPPPHVRFFKLPIQRELWPGLQEWYYKCELDGGKLDLAGRPQDDRVRSLDDRMANILAEKQQLERGIDVAALRADSTSRDLMKKIEDRCTQIKALDKSF